MKEPNRLMDYVFKGLMVCTIIIYAIAFIAWVAHK